jgi:glycosyltransferase involved in cell wall biosynthesis
VRIATLANASVIHTQRWVRHFRARGHEVRVWSLEAGPDDLAAELLPSAPLPTALRYPWAAPALRRALAAWAPDLVDAHYVPNYGVLAVLTGRHPLSVAAWGSDLLVAAPRDALQRARARWVLGRADLVRAVGRGLADAARRLGADPARLHSIPWGVSRERFHPAGPRVPGRLLSTRMHEPIYDLPALLRGVAPLMRRMDSLTLHVAGDGSERGTLERLAARELPAGRVRFLGRLTPESLAAELAAAEIYLSASRSDSTSLSLLEAMACGAIPVVSDIEGNREWVGEGEGARLFAPGDAAQVAAAIERALASEEWRERARSRNLRTIVERGDWDTQLGRIEALFERLAAAGGRAPAGAGR